MGKRAFTLIEVIIAIAILAIGYVAIASAFNLSISAWDKGDAKLRCINYAEGIKEGFSEGGYSRLNHMCNNPQNSYFVYFDEEFKNFTSNSITGEATDFSIWIGNEYKINQNVSTEADGTYIDPNLYQNCKTGNTLNNKYGCYIMIKYLTSNTYYLKIKVWDLKDAKGQDNSATRETIVKN